MVSVQWNTTLEAALIRIGHLVLFGFSKVELGHFWVGRTRLEHVAILRNHICAVAPQGEKRACQRIGLAEPVRMLGKKRFVLEA
jgi:hypothetical protein